MNIWTQKVPKGPTPPRGGLRQTVDQVMGEPLGGRADWAMFFDFREYALLLPCNAGCAPVSFCKMSGDFRECAVFLNSPGGSAEASKWIGTGLEMSWIAWALVVCGASLDQKKYLPLCKGPTGERIGRIL